MRRFFTTTTLVLFSFFALPWPVLAGSCECLDININDPSAQTRTCSFPSGVNTEQDCSSHNGTTLNSSSLSECTYYNNDNCLSRCLVEVSSLRTPSNKVTCRANTDCEEKISYLTNNAVAKCCESQCYFDAAGLEIINNGTTAGQTVTIKKPILEISIPGVSFSDNKNLLDNQGYINIPYLGEYLAAVYKFAVGAASIIAVIVIILNGFRITISAGGEEKNTGIQNIGKALTGLFILWSSYALFYAINPDLVQFKALRVKYIKGVDEKAILASIKSADSIKGTAKKCGGYSDTALNAGINSYIVSAAKETGIDPLVLAAIFQKENNGNPTPVRGPCGEVGVTQIMPSTLDGLQKSCCVASNKKNGNCTEVKSSETIGEGVVSEPPYNNEPYTFECKTAICGHCDQASPSCVEYFHGEDGLQHSMTYSAMLIKNDILKYAEGDIALIFAGYNGGASPNSQALQYAQDTVNKYNQLCQKIGGTQ